MSSSVSNEPREFLSGKLAQVDVGKIENELRSLWKQATNDADGIAGDVVRAVSFTLVLFSHDESTEQELADVLDDITTFHPCRAILSFFRPDKPHALDAYVSARCHLLADKRHVCSEQITVFADGAKPEELVSVVSPLVLPDLPVVLWWRSRNLNDGVMQHLHKCARKVIFDSGYQPFERSALIDAADLLKQRGNCIWLADLNWRRLNGWRRSLAEAFDGFPMPPEYLQQIKKVSIHVRGDEKAKGLSTQALLLAGWLSSRLELKQLPVEFASSQDNTAAVNGGIDAVDIEFADGRKLNVVLESNDHSFLITAHEKSANAAESIRVDQHFPEGVLVGQELELMSRDAIFEQSLLRAGELSRNIK